MRLGSNIFYLPKKTIAPTNKRIADIIDNINAINDNRVGSSSFCLYIKKNDRATMIVPIIIPQ